MIEIQSRLASVEQVFVQTADDTEYQLIRTAQEAANSGNWIVGECACRWLHTYAKGRTDAEFGELIGLSKDQVFQRRRVWEEFGNSHHCFVNVTWTHFREALQWDDAEECLQWANEQEATVKEMTLWRKAQRGELLPVQPKESDDSSRRQPVKPEGRTIHRSVDERPPKPEGRVVDPAVRTNPEPPTLREKPPTLRPEVTTLAPKDTTVDPTTTVQMALRKIGHMIQFVVENGSASEKRELREKLSNFVDDLSEGGGQ